MSVMLSIKPKYAEKILTGHKKFEFRKKIWKRERNIKKVYIYATSPVKKILGFFTINTILKGNPKKLWEICREFAGISESEFFKYFDGHLQSYAIGIKKVVKYDIPIEKDILIGCLKAPQNFMYINENYVKINHDFTIK